MASGFPDSITQPTAFAYLNSYYPYSQRITVRLDNRTVSAVPPAQPVIPPVISSLTAGQILTNPDGTLSVLTAGLFSTAATVYVPTKGLLILEDGRITTTTPGLLMHPAGSNLVPSAGLLLHPDGTISIPKVETPSVSSGGTSDATSEFFLHPEGTNYYSVQFYTGATVSSFSHNSGTTASLTIRAYPGAIDALYSVTTVNGNHPTRSNNYALGNGESENSGEEWYYFTFVVSQSSSAVRELCRAALYSGSVPFVAEIKLEQPGGRTFTSNSFPITCFTPVIRSEQF